MNRQGRGSTGPGRPSALPDHGYEPPAPVRELPDGRLLVAFHGDDDRRRVFDVSKLPLPGWHRALAAVVAERTGPAGGLRTFAAATTGWGSLSRLVKFLGALPEPPAGPDQLTLAHLQAFHDHRATTTPTTALRDMGEARLLFALPALRDHRIFRRGTGPAAGRAAGGCRQDPQPHPGRGGPPSPLPGRPTGAG
ncbi:hypothetical protein [Streptomyces sp. NPDC006463]|uniref:hypothetical protein n=1 Tax=Streptomyces sp. NPDC006463 TaxID=3364746 RepID=UPI00367C081C